MSGVYRRTALRECSAFMTPTDFLVDEMASIYIQREVHLFFDADEENLKIEIYKFMAF